MVDKLCQFFTKKNNYYICLILFFLWMLIGILPLMSYESDSSFLIMGCDVSKNQGWMLPPYYSYEYDMQPLISNIVILLSKLIKIFSSEQIYCIITALSSFIFIIGCVNFTYIITNFEKIFILFILILLPESYAISMYPNSAIPAAAIFIWALISILKNRYILSLFLFCIAPLFRVDILIVYPSLFPLLYYKGFILKKSLYVSFFYAIFIILFLLLSNFLLCANPINSLNGYNTWNKLVPFSKILSAILGFYGCIYLILIPIGFISMLKKKEYKILFLVSLPILLLHFVYRSMGCASKHYLYIAPFCLVISMYAFFKIKLLIKRNNFLKFVSCFALLFYLFGSIKIDFSNYPWKNTKNSLSKCGPYYSFYKKDIVDNKLSLGVGVGQIVPTLDEQMIGTGQFFYSLYIHNLKVKKLNYLNNIQSELSSCTNCLLVVIEYNDMFSFANRLLNDDYHFSYNENLMQFSKSNSKIEQLYFDINDYSNFNDLFKSLCLQCMHQYKNDIYFVSFNDKSMFFLNEFSQNNSLIKKCNPCLYKLVVK